MISTTTSLSSSANPSTYGDSVSFTATVTGSSGTANISGTVTFFAGGVAIGSASVSGAGNTGVAVFALSTLLGGSNSITAAYSGDGNYSPSTSSALSQTVNPFAQLLELASDPLNSSVYGQAVILTVFESAPLPDCVPPSGFVTFKDGANTIGTAPFVPGLSGVVATLSVSNLAVGDHSSITAEYPGDSNYQSTTASLLSFTVDQAGTTTTVTSSVNPSALCQPVTFTAKVTATSPGRGTPTGTVTFTIDGTPGSPISLSNGVATYSTSSLTQTTHSVSAAYNGDSNFNTSSSGTLTQTVNAAVNWVISASAAAPDPLQAMRLALGLGAASVNPLTGNLSREVGFDPNQHTVCDCGCECKDDNVKAGTNPLAIAHNSSTVAVKPIIVAKLQTDFCDSVPSQVQARLTWNGTAQSTVTYATTGHSAGDVYAMPLQVASAVSSSGIYPWSVYVKATVGTFIHDGTVSGDLPVIANDSSPFGPGWSIAGWPALLIGSNGVAIIDNRGGGTRYFTGTPGSLPFTYTSPANDQGTLVKNANGTYTYTAKDRTQTNYDSSGRITSQTDSNGLTQSFSYASPLTTITQPDGGIATFAYTSNLLSSITLPGSRTFSMTYDGSGNLTGIADPAGGLHTLAYDASHRLTNERIGPLNTTYAYDANGALQSIDRGLGSLTTVTAAAVQGLGAATVINDTQSVAVVTDPLNHATTYALDPLGRLTKLQAADGAVQTWELNAAGNPTVYTDALGRKTLNTYNASQDLTVIEYPDATKTSYAYDATFHEVTRIEDALNRVTTLAYDATTGDLLTVIDALGNRTTYTWSSGLKQTMTDALGRVTTYTWDSTKRRELGIQDVLGNRTTFAYDAAGNKTSEQDALGRLTTMTYDGMRRMLTRKNALNALATYVYDAIGNMTSSVDELSRTTSYGYDQRGLRTTTTEAVGTSQQRTTTTTYDAATNVLYVTDALGDITSFAYDAVNRPTRRIDAYGTSVARTTTTSYDAVGNVLATVDPRSVTTSYAYDPLNRRSATIQAYGDALQRTTTTAYDAVGNVRTVTNPRSTTTSFGYDAVNRQTLRIDAYGVSGLERTTTTVYDAVGNTRSVTNAVGAVTSFVYDALNRQTQMIEAYGVGDLARTTTTVYDAVGNVRSITNPRGILTSFAYDALNRRVNQYDDNGGSLARTLTMAYDAAGNLLSATNGRGIMTSYSYDALNRRSATIQDYGGSLARTLTTVYDAADNVTVEIDALGFRTTYGYDALNRRITVKNPNSDVATTVYDANDNIVNGINPLGNKTTYVYDVLNRRSATIQPDGGIVTLAYDANNNLLSLTDPVNNKTQWLYDALDRKIKEIDPNSFSATFAYDAIDRLTSTTDKKAQVINYTYDLLNRQIGATGYSGSGLLTFTFDGNNNLLTAQTATSTITSTYDALDRLATTKDGYNTLLTNTYDAADNRTLVVDSFSGTSTRVYDALNRVTTMLYSGQSANLREDFSYTARDQQSLLTRYSNLAATVTVGTTSMGYDAVGRLTNLQHKDGSNANIANYTHTYDVASRVTTEKLNGGATTTYQYDNTDQLTNDAVVTYSYDANGNRTMSGYSTGPNNQLTSDGTWNYYADKNGNITQKIKPSTGEIWNFGYDNRNRLTTVTDTTSAGLQMQGTYTHDALGQRVQKSVWTSSGGTTTTTRFAYDNRQIIADLDGSNALQTRYLLGTRILERYARVSSAGTVAWLLADRLGSTRNVVNSGGSTIDTAAFDGFGNIVSQSSPSNGGAYLYAGYRVDSETGLLIPDPTWGRVYGPPVGRWWMVDPIGFLAGDSNLWRYCLNNPTNHRDPSGVKTRAECEEEFRREKERCKADREACNAAGRPNSECLLAYVRCLSKALFLYDLCVEPPIPPQPSRPIPSEPFPTRFRITRCTGEPPYNRAVPLDLSFFKPQPTEQLLPCPRPPVRVVPPPTPIDPSVYGGPPRRESYDGFVPPIIFIPIGGQPPVKPPLPASPPGPPTQYRPSPRPARPEPGILQRFGIGFIIPGFLIPGDEDPFGMNWLS